MNNYEDLSDFSIEYLVVKSLGWEILNYDKDDELLVVRSENVVGRFKPCSIPNHAFNIIIDNKLTISPCSTDRWMVARYKGGLPDINVFDKNPLRAAMICFLEIKDAENGE